MTDLSRRDFIRGLATVGFLGLGGCNRLFTKKNSKARVIVVGGGFGGATVSRYLRQLDPAIEVILVEPKRSYLTCPGSNRVIAGLQTLQSLAMHYDGLRSRGVSVIHDAVAVIDPVQRRLRLQAGGSQLEYDRLVLSPGIDFIWDSIEGYDASVSEQMPHAWQAGEQTLLLRRQLESMTDGGVVLIAPPKDPYRCPPGPYERASLIAWYLQRYKPRSKILIVDSKRKFAKQALFMRSWQRLYPDKIEWIARDGEAGIEYANVRNKMLATEFGVFSGDVVNLIPPQKAGRIAEQTGLTDSGGWCPVNPQTFESTQAPGIHVIGDACRAAPMPKSGFSANAQAKTCAAAIVDELNGHALRQAVLINTCYSFVAPDQAISVSGVYAYETRTRKLITRSSGVSTPDADAYQEARHANHWYQTMTAEVFGESN